MLNKDDIYTNDSKDVQMSLAGNRLFKDYKVAGSAIEDLLKESRMVDIDNTITIDTDENMVVMVGDGQVCEYAYLGQRNNNQPDYVLVRTVSNEGYICFYSGKSGKYDRNKIQIVAISGSKIVLINQNLFAKHLQNLFDERIQADFQFLRTIELTKNSSSELLYQISKRAARCTSGQGVTLYKCGDRSEYIYFLRKGKVSFKQMNSNKVVFISAPEIMGVDGVFVKNQKQERCFTVETQTNTQYLKINKRQIILLMLVHANVEKPFTKRINLLDQVDIVKSIEQQILDLNAKRIKEKQQKGRNLRRRNPQSAKATFTNGKEFSDLNIINNQRANTTRITRRQTMNFITSANFQDSPQLKQRRTIIISPFSETQESEIFKESIRISPVQKDKPTIIVEKNKLREGASGSTNKRDKERLIKQLERKRYMELSTKLETVRANKDQQKRSDQVKIRRMFNKSAKKSAPLTTNLENKLYQQLNNLQQTSPLLFNFEAKRTKYLELKPVSMQSARERQRPSKHILIVE